MKPKTVLDVSMANLGDQFDYHDLVEFVRLFNDELPPDVLAFPVRANPTTDASIFKTPEIASAWERASHRLGR
jgi:hypothetical protein